MSVTLPRESLEYLSFSVDTDPVDPASLVHEVAIVPELSQPSGWTVAPYVDGKVLVLVRASTDAEAGGLFTLALGRWRLWWRSEAFTETPVRQVGVISVQ